MAQAEITPPSDEHFAERLLTSLERAVALLAVLLLMGTIGLVLTNVRSQYAFHYWAAMLPLFGIAALWEELRRRPAGAGFGPVTLRLVAHWTGPLAALWIVFRLLHRGQVDCLVGAPRLRAFYRGAPGLGEVRQRPGDRARLAPELAARQGGEGAAHRLDGEGLVVAGQEPRRRFRSRGPLRRPRPQLGPDRAPQLVG